MVMFHSYVSLPEGKPNVPNHQPENIRTNSLLNLRPQAGPGYRANRCGPGQDGAPSAVK